MENNDRLRDKFSRISEVRKKEEVYKQEKFAERSKEKLISVIDKKFKTTFIGALSCIESEIGFLWGHGKELNELTENEKKWAVVWERIRTNILNNGNNQARAVTNELQQYAINWQGYYTKLPGGQSE